ncbi:MAG: TolC family protein [Bacteroidota bacterium]
MKRFPMACLLSLAVLFVSRPAASQDLLPVRAEPVPLEALVANEVARLAPAAGPSPAVSLWEAPTGAAPTASLIDPVVLGPDAAGLVTRPDALARDLGLLRRTLAPSLTLEHVAFVVHPRAASLPGAADRLAAAAAEADLQALTMLPAGSAEAVLEALAERPYDAIYIDAGTGLEAEALRTLAEGLATRGMPSLTAAPSLVEHGFLAAASPNFEERLARQVALRLQEAEAGGRATAPPAVVTQAPARLTFNAGLVRTLALDLSWQTLLEATFIGDAEAGVRPLTIDDAIRRAAEENLEVVAQQLGLQASQAELRAARSALLPQLTTSTTARLVNEDLGAAALGGANPERLWTLDATLEQVLFAERAFAGLSIQRKLTAVQTFERNNAQLVAAATAAHTFLDALRAETGVAIAQERINRIQVDLESAELRQQAGLASPADVAQLRAQAASARQDLARALGGTEAATFALNQALNLDLNTPTRPVIPADGARFQPTLQVIDLPAETDALASPRALIATIPVLPSLLTPARTEAVAADFSAVAVAEAPIAEALATLVEVQERQVTSARRSVFLPEVGLFATGTTRLAEGGAGLGVPPGLPIPLFPNETWAVGVRARFPLFQGGRRLAQRQQAEAEAAQAQTRLSLIQQRLEQGARTATTLLATSYAAYVQTELATAAAAEAYDDVARLYREGVVSVTALVEAQEALRLSEELTAAAAYDVAAAYVELQQTTGRFDALAEDTPTGGLLTDGRAQPHTTDDSEDGTP